MDNDDFLGDASLAIRDGEEVDAVDESFHGIVICFADANGFQFEAVDQGARHVMYFDVEFAFHVFEAQLHLSVIGVGDDVDCGRVGFLFFDAIEGGVKPVFGNLAFRAMVHRLEAEADGIRHPIHGIHGAAEIVVGGDDAPTLLADAPLTLLIDPCRVGFWVAGEIGVTVDVEFGGGDGPMGILHILVTAFDDRFGGELHVLKIEVDSIVASFGSMPIKNGVGVVVEIERVAADKRVVVRIDIAYGLDVTICDNNVIGAFMVDDEVQFVDSVAGERRHRNSVFVFCRFGIELSVDRPIIGVANGIVGMLHFRDLLEMQVKTEDALTGLCGKCVDIKTVFV